MYPRVRLMEGNRAARVVPSRCRLKPLRQQVSGKFRRAVPRLVPTRASAEWNVRGRVRNVSGLGAQIGQVLAKRNHRECSERLGQFERRAFQAAKVRNVSRLGSPNGISGSRAI